jgi:hypothetical protein
MQDWRSANTIVALALALGCQMAVGAEDDSRLILAKYRSFDGSVSYSVLADDAFRQQAAEIRKEPGYLRNAVHAARAEWTKIERARRKEYRDERRTARENGESFDEKFESNQFPNLRLATPSLTMASTHTSHEEADARIAQLEEYELKRHDRKDSRKARPAHASSTASSKQADVARRYEEAIESIRAHLDRIRVEADMDTGSGLVRTGEIDKRLGSGTGRRLVGTKPVKTIGGSGSTRSESTYPTRKMGQ